MSPESHALRRTSESVCPVPEVALDCLGKVPGVAFTTIQSFLLADEVFSVLFGFKKFPLTFPVYAARVVDAPADFSVVDYFFNFHVRCLSLP